MSSKKTIPSDTPLMRQHAELKSKYPGALLLFRVGDFYETFGEDAERVSKVLDIVLTKRSNGSASAVPLAGFPYHALDLYMPKLIRAGLRVAVCDQLEDPKKAKGLVKRGVTELLSPGVAYHDEVLQRRRNNYLASLHFGKKEMGISFLDLSTGEYLTTQGDQYHIEKLIGSFQPSEILFSKEKRQLFQTLFGDRNDLHTHSLDPWIYTHSYAYELLTTHFGTPTLKGFGIEQLQAGIIASGAIMHYLKEMEQHHIHHLTALKKIEQERYLWLDPFTIRNLEILQPQQEGGIALIDIVDKSKTAMGARLLQKWLLLPLKELKAIQQREQMVSHMLQFSSLREKLIYNLQKMGDIERLISKVAARRITPRELYLLYISLTHIPHIKQLLLTKKEISLHHFGKKLSVLDSLLHQLHHTLREDAPTSNQQGGIIRSGVDQELDEFIQLTEEGVHYLEEMLATEREKTGISSLKISYNKVFGYYLEVRHTHKEKVPTHWIRKQTLVNAERYITEELKNFEEKILHAENKRYTLEHNLYLQLVEEVAAYVPQIQNDAQLVAQIDIYCGFAELAKEYDYCKPTLNDGEQIIIQGGRHPVIERHLPIGQNYQPNDIIIDREEQQILLLTGPNMAGKSAYLRQVALIVLLAQIGSFVPAKRAAIGLVDKIYTRVGASDNLAKGESTFMVEMLEAANILNNLTPRTLAIIDELGRGTGTIDGCSIAQAIIEYLHNHPTQARTLFATHYHTLNHLTSELPRIKNYHVAVKKVNGKIHFLHQVKPGGTSHSFGTEVAKMAGLPQPIIHRANQLVEHASQKSNFTNHTPPASTSTWQIFQPDAASIRWIEEIKKINVDQITPIDALFKLAHLKKMMEAKNNKKKEM